MKWGWALNWQNFIGAVAVFLGLQFASFVVAILANGSTPPATRLAQLLRSTMADQRKEAAIDRLSRLILVQAYPYRTVGSLVVLSAIAVIFFVMPGSFFALLSAEERGPKLGVLSLEFMSPQKRAGVHMALFGFCLLASMFAMNIVMSYSDYLTHPRRVADKALRLLQRRGMSEEAAWIEAKSRAAKRSFDAPKIP